MLAKSISSPSVTTSLVEVSTSLSTSTAVTPTQLTQVASADNCTNSAPAAAADTVPAASSQTSTPKRKKKKQALPKQGREESTGLAAEIEPKQNASLPPGNSVSGRKRSRKQQISTLTDVIELETSPVTAKKIKRKGKGPNTTPSGAEKQTKSVRSKVKSEPKKATQQKPKQNLAKTTPPPVKSESVSTTTIGRNLLKQVNKKKAELKKQFLRSSSASVSKAKGPTEKKVLLKRSDLADPNLAFQVFHDSSRNISAIGPSQVILAAESVIEEGTLEDIKRKEDEFLDGKVNVVATAQHEIGRLLSKYLSSPHYLPCKTVYSASVPFTRVLKFSALVEFTGGIQQNNSCATFYNCPQPGVQKEKVLRQSRDQLYKGFPQNTIIIKHPVYFYYSKKPYHLKFFVLKKIKINGNTVAVIKAKTVNFRRTDDLKNVSLDYNECSISEVPADVSEMNRQNIQPVIHTDSGFVPVVNRIAYLQQQPQQQPVLQTPRYEQEQFQYVQYQYHTPSELVYDHEPSVVRTSVDPTNFAGASHTSYDYSSSHYTLPAEFGNNVQGEQGAHHIIIVTNPDSGSLTLNNSLLQLQDIQQQPQPQQQVSVIQQQSGTSVYNAIPGQFIVQQQSSNHEFFVQQSEIAKQHPPAPTQTPVFCLDRSNNCVKILSNPNPVKNVSTGLPQLQSSQIQQQHHTVQQIQQPGTSQQQVIVQRTEAHQFQLTQVNQRSVPQEQPEEVSVVKRPVHQFIPQQGSSTQTQIFQQPTHIATTPQHTQVETVILKTPTRFQSQSSQLQQVPQQSQQQYQPKLQYQSVIQKPQPQQQYQPPQQVQNITAPAQLQNSTSIVPSSLSVPTTHRSQFEGSSEALPSALPVSAPVAAGVSKQPKPKPKKEPKEKKPTVSKKGIFNTNSPSQTQLTLISTPSTTNSSSLSTPVVQTGSIAAPADNCALPVGSSHKAPSTPDIVRISSGSPVPQSLFKDLAGKILQVTSSPQSLATVGSRVNLSAASSPKTLYIQVPPKSPAANVSELKTSTVQLQNKPSRKPGFLAVCPHCGLSNASIVKCKRCGANFPESVRLIKDTWVIRPDNIIQAETSNPVPPVASPLPAKVVENKSTVVRTDKPVAIIKKTVGQRKIVLVNKPALFSAPAVQVKFQGEGLGSPVTIVQTGSGALVSKVISTGTTPAAPKKRAPPRKKQQVCITLSSDEEDEPATKTSKVENNPSASSTSTTTEKVIPSVIVKSSDSSGSAESKIQAFEKSVEPAKREPSLADMTSTEKMSKAKGISINIDLNNQKIERPESPDGEPPEKVLEKIEAQLQEQTGGKFQFVKMECRSIRVGSYKVTNSDFPNLHVNFTELGITFTLPYSNYKHRKITMCIPLDRILNFLVSFNKRLPVIFLKTGMKYAKWVRTALGMDDRCVNEHSTYYCPVTGGESQQAITILVMPFMDADVGMMKKMYLNKLEEIDYAVANAYLMKITPDSYKTSISYQASDAVTRVCSPSTSKVANTISVQAVTSGNMATPTKLATALIKTETATAQSSSLPVVSSCSSTISVTSSNVDIDLEGMILYYEAKNSKIPICPKDIMCLSYGQFLNDQIIEFWLAVIQNEILSESDRKRTFVYDSFFYNKLTEKKKKTAEDGDMTPAERRHARVKKRTKNVDIFAKDYLIVPINENYHWFIAVICFPGMQGYHDYDTLEELPKYVSSFNKRPRLSAKKNPPIVSKQPQSESTASYSNRDEAPGDPEEAEELKNTETVSSEDSQSSLPKSDDRLNETEKKGVGVKRKSEATYQRVKHPCILIFDSLAGDEHSRIFSTLREYLKIEYKTRKGVDRVYDKAMMPGVMPKVPQQPNFSDCGVFMLQYIESLFSKPVYSYDPKGINLKQWFEPDQIAANKRRQIFDFIRKQIEEKYPQNVCRIPQVNFEPDADQMDASMSVDHEDESMDDDMDIDPDYDEDDDDEDDMFEEIPAERRPKVQTPQSQILVISSTTAAVTTTAVSTPTASTSTRSKSTQGSVKVSLQFSTQTK